MKIFVLVTPLYVVIELAIILNGNAETVARSTIADKFNYFLRAKELYNNKKKASTKVTRSGGKAPKFTITVKNIFYLKFIFNSFYY